MKKILAMMIVPVMLMPTTLVYALEVDREVMPRITIGGRVISTMDSIDNESDPTAESEINIDDSVLLTRFDKRLYGGGVAGAVLGLREDDGNAVFHETRVFFWNEDLQINIGKTRLRNSVIEFPTLRDEDLLTYSHIGNASSNDELHQIYGNLLSVDWIFDRKYQKFGAWLGSLEDDPAIGHDGLDHFGFAYDYEVSEDLRYVSGIRHAGVKIDRQKVNLVNNQWKSAVVFGIEFNLNADPTANWSMGVQAVINSGLDGISAAQLVNANAVANRSRAKSRALITSIRYTSRPHLLTRWQAALNLAYKDYSDIDNATQWTMTPSFVYTIGQGVDLLAQLSHTSYESSLGAADDIMLQIGVSFGFDAMFNDNIGERDSILNMEHGYID